MKEDAYRNGTYKDIEIPIEHAQVFMERLDAEVGFGRDESKCYKIDDSLFNIRVTFRTIGQGACHSFVEALAKELGIDNI